MNTTPDALIAVGKDCDCGHPLVWRNGQQWCSVYGSHPVIIGRRYPNAIGARLVRELSKPVVRKLTALPEAS